MTALVNAACIRIEKREVQKFELIARRPKRHRAGVRCDSVPGCGAAHAWLTLAGLAHRLAEGSCNQMENTPSTLQKTMNSQGERRKNISDL